MKSSTVYSCCHHALYLMPFLAIIHSAASNTLTDLAEKQANILNELYEKNKPDVLLNDAQEIVYGGLHEMRARITDLDGDFWNKFDGSVQVFFRNHRRNPEQIGEHFTKFVEGFQKKNKGLIAEGKTKDVFNTGISDIEGKLEEYFKDRPGLKATVLSYLFGGAAFTFPPSLTAPLKYIG